MKYEYKLQKGKKQKQIDKQTKNVECGIAYFTSKWKCCLS